MLLGLLLLSLVSEACQISTSDWMSIDSHWLACTAATLVDDIGYEFM